MNVDAINQFAEFFTHLENQRRLSAHTITSYQRDLRSFSDYCQREQIPDWQQVTHEQVRAFAAESHRKGLSGRSVQRRLSALRSLFNFLMMTDVLKQNPAQSVRSPKDEKKLPHCLDTDQMQAVLDTAAPTNWLQQRDLAMMELMYSSGLRLAELVSLNLPQLDLKNAEVRVTGKGEKTRILPVGRKAIISLQNWLQERALHCADDETAAFINRSGSRLSRSSVQKRIRQWNTQQGLGLRLHPHVLRHSFASHILESSHDLRAVQELLGHANLSTTQIYTHLDFQHLAEVYDDAHPRARKQRGKR
ncbi:MAG: tyrosine recombinase XerC [Gammaproteobacteria bacterium]